MQKTTLYLIIVAIAAVTILGIFTEYFNYKYYALSVGGQSNSQSTQVAANSESVGPVAASNPAVSGSPENAITSFDFETPPAVGGINPQNHTITFALPPDTDVTRLAPSIEISNDATISPASGTMQDFTNPVTYTVTAQNGSTQTYTVTVNVISSVSNVQKIITSFTLPQFNPLVNGFINNTTDTIYVVVPDGTDLTKLTPTIQVSPNATLSPASGTMQDFTNPVTYTVTDLYDNTQTYTVNIVTQSNSG